MTPSEVAYCAKVFADTNAAIGEVEAEAKTTSRTGWSVNWADLRCVAVERVESFYGDGEPVTEWRVLVSEASPSATEFAKALTRRLVAREHYQVNVVTEW